MAFFVCSNNQGCPPSRRPTVDADGKTSSRIWPPAEKQRCSKNSGSAEGSSQLLDWLQIEVVARLQKLDTRMDQLAQQLEHSIVEEHLVERRRLFTTSAGGAHGQWHSQHVRPARTEDCGVAQDTSPGTAASETAVESNLLKPPPLAITFDPNSSFVVTNTKLGKPAGDMFADSVDAPHMDASQLTESDYCLSHKGNRDEVCEKETNCSRTPRAKRHSVKVHEEEEPPTNPSMSVTLSHRLFRRSKVRTGQEAMQQSGSASGWRARALAFFDNPDSSKVAWVYAHAMPVLGMISAFVTVYQATENPPLCGIPAAIVEITFDGIFALEIAARLIVAPNLCSFIGDFYNIVDIIGLIPLIVRVTTMYVRPCAGLDTGLEATILLCFTPILRVLKTLRRFEKFALIVVAFEEAWDALPICVYTLLLLTMSFSTAIYLAEDRDNIPSLSTAMWLTIVTATTVGYGDITPQTTLGALIVSCLVVSSVLYLAMPLGIVGQSFTEVWSDRDRILLKRKTRDSLNRWGYTASDIPALFDLFDHDGNRELDFHEFKTMIEKMGMGMSHQRIIKLFDAIDEDNSGIVDDKEFVRGLFGPQVYFEVYTLREAGALPYPDSPYSSHSHGHQG